MKALRAAILGYGRSGGTMHAGAVEKSDRFDMAAVCDVDREQLNKAAERFGCPVYENYHTMLDAEALDLVCVITRSDQHCQMACDCLAAGVNVLVTKPWAVNEAEATRMIAAAGESGKLLLPWLPARWSCDLARLREVVDAGTIGKVFTIRRTVTSFGTRCDWQTERRHGGGYLLNWGPHIIDTALQLAGGEVSQVYGRLSQVINPGDGEDQFLALITMADGTLVQAEYTVGAEDLPHWFVQGDAGTAVIQDRNLKIHRHTPQQATDPTQFTSMLATGDKTTDETLGTAQYGDEHVIYEEIADAVQGQRDFAVTPEAALQLTRVFDAVRASAEENRVVVLQP